MSVLRGVGTISHDLLQLLTFVLVLPVLWNQALVSIMHVCQRLEAVSDWQTYLTLLMCLRCLFSFELVTGSGCHSG